MKESILESLHDPELRSALISSITEGAIVASQDDALSGALYRSASQAVLEAFGDDRLISGLQQVAREVLKDPNLHRAAIKGAVSNLNPLHNASSSYS